MTHLRWNWLYFTR